MSATTTTTGGPCPGGWVAEWYSNRSLSGSPVVEFYENGAEATARVSYAPG